MFNRMFMILFDLSNDLLKYLLKIFLKKPSKPIPSIRRSLLWGNKVAIATVEDYNKDTIKENLSNMFDSIGGLENIINSNSKVAIKINLTAGFGDPDDDRSIRHWVEDKGISATEAFWTHPAVIQAVCELIIEIGVHDLNICEALWDHESLNDYRSIMDELDIPFIDLNDNHCLKHFLNWRAYHYKIIKLHKMLKEIDVFISISKMKCHRSVGVTHTMKNLIGITPFQDYTNNYINRDKFHRDSNKEMAYHLPKSIVDINLARPITLSVIDGIKTIDGGEGPWWNNVVPIEPHVLITGTNAVATDAVAMDVQGFNPMAGDFQEPFNNSCNYLALAKDKGLGTNNLEDIQIYGESIEDVTTQFHTPPYDPNCFIMLPGRNINFP